MREEHLLLELAFELGQRNPYAIELMMKQTDGFSRVSEDLRGAAEFKEHIQIMDTLVWDFHKNLDHLSQAAEAITESGVLDSMDASEDALAQVEQLSRALEEEKAYNARLEGEVGELKRQLALRPQHQQVPRRQRTGPPSEPLQKSIARALHGKASDTSK